MSKAPTMPMFWDAYLADTTHLSLEEHGAYFLLLGAMWRRDGWVPDDDGDNARILKVTKPKWKKLKTRLASMLLFESGQISQKKLLDTWTSTQEKINANRRNGAKGGRPKLNKSNDLVKANGSTWVKRTQTIPDPDPDPDPEPKEEDKSSSSESRQSYYDRYLRAHPKPVDTARGRSYFNAMLDDGIDPEKIIEAALRYKTTSKNFSDKNFIQQSDNFLGPEYGKIKDMFSAKAHNLASEDEVLRFWAAIIEKGRLWTVNSFSETQAWAMVEKGYVTKDKLSEGGFFR